MSFLSNPVPNADSQTGDVVPPQASLSLDENPSWSGWDVLGIVILTIVAIFSFLLVVTYATQRLFYPNLPMVDVARFPLLTVVAQLLAYIVVLAYMVSLVKRDSAKPFLTMIRWNWPAGWVGYLFGGVVLSLALQGVAHLLPMPKELPIDRFFRTAAEAWALSIFGVTFAPLMEEFFFRGFLYPVLRRRLGLPLGVILTAACFGLIHAPQLGRAWGPVLVVFLVGVALTLTRAMTKSVAASLLMHIAYNGTISVLIFFASDGFRNLEKLNQ